jgi:hypothetical protein
MINQPDHFVQASCGLGCLFRASATFVTARVRADLRVSRGVPVGAGAGELTMPKVCQNAMIFEPLALVLSEKQIPEVIIYIKK